MMPCIAGSNSAVGRSISGFRLPQSRQLLVKEAFVLFEYSDPILSARDDVAPGASERCLVHGTRCRAATLREGNPIARCRRANRPFFGRCPWSTLIHCCSRKWLRRNSRYTARGAHRGDQRTRRTAGGLLRFENWPALRCHRRRRQAFNIFPELTLV